MTVMPAICIFWAVQGVPFLRRPIGCDLAPMGGVTHPGPFRGVRGTDSAPSTGHENAAAGASAHVCNPRTEAGCYPGADRRRRARAHRTALGRRRRGGPAARAAAPLRGRRGRRLGAHAALPRLLADASHELHTPLAGYAELMLVGVDARKIAPEPAWRRVCGSVGADEGTGRPRCRGQGGSRAGLRGDDRPGAPRPRRGGRRAGDTRFTVTLPLAAARSRTTTGTA